MKPKNALLKGISLQEVIDGRRNNFDLLRLCAALAVMFGHSFWIQPAHGRIEPILKHTALEYSGSLAVYTFFLISGMLVASSFARQKSAGRFIALRLARIYPALIACVFLTAFILYPLLSNRGFLTTVTSSDARIFFVKNSWLFSDIQWTLPGLFETAPLKSVVNGSLWTLPLELKCYMFILITGLLGAFRSKWRSAAACILASALFAYLATHGSAIDFFRYMVDKPTGYSFYAAPFFILGAALYSFREYIKVNWATGIVLFVAYAIFRTSTIAAPFFYVAFVYLLLLVASAPSLNALRPKNDYSYGAYLWAFPVQQIVASKYPHMDNLLGLCLSIPATLMLAAASWHLIEKPCIRFAHDRLKSGTRINQPQDSERMA